MEEIEKLKRQWDTVINDQVNHPKHYTEHPSGVECIQIVEHMGFNLGNVIKYIWRADLKGYSNQDLEKARWYLDREIKKRKAIGSGSESANQSLVGTPVETPSTKSERPNDYQAARENGYPEPPFSKRSKTPPTKTSR